MITITKKIARQFAKEFFGIKIIEKVWLPDNPCFGLGPIQLEIFPKYGKGTGNPYPYGHVTVCGYDTGNVQFIDGCVVYESLAGKAIDLMQKLSQTLLKSVNEKNINACNADKCIESNLMLFKAVELAQKAENF